LGESVDNTRYVAGMHVGRTFCIVSIFVDLVLYFFVTSHYSFGADFATFWSAGKAVFIEHISPYSQQVSERIQKSLWWESSFFLYRLFLLLSLQVTNRSKPKQLYQWSAQFGWCDYSPQNQFLIVR
jgi:hypothetical protein